ncbi:MULTISPECIES: sigma-70 family RNA polymerase sigma factor [Enterococcaceae]|nr:MULTISPECIES: sigma-70 family RNA polymerase sigma factor [Enterococcus]MDT2688430.1 sigma-70 family RNA polymerase sigma factor [Enterococcus gallinarum]MDT2706927.1 sigma-70 family RNA polymerase sigma factor [Enterococcus dispar]QMU12148.1 sigma-70 family RNA polymerase sigma factor [Mammaliicoccus lentus]
MIDFIMKLQQQQEKALEYVIDTYMPYVKAIAKKILQYSCGNTAVDECVNDVFLAVWQNSLKFNGSEQEFKKWIGTIAKFKAIDMYRKQQKSETVSLDQVKEQVNYETGELLYLRKEQKDSLLIEIQTLPDTERELFLMKYYLDLSNGEIAAALGISKSAVENRLYRGKKKLATLPTIKERLE